MIKGVHTMFYSSEPEALRAFLRDKLGFSTNSFARRQPERVKRLVIGNTWCWPVRDEFHFIWFSFFMSSWIWRWRWRISAGAPPSTGCGCRQATSSRKRGATGLPPSGARTHCTYDPGSRLG